MEVFGDGAAMAGPPYHIRTTSGFDSGGQVEQIEKTVILERLFDEINQQHFDGFLEMPRLMWNSRLRSSAGRFFANMRGFGPAIEIASYLQEEQMSEALIRDTLAHEMIHYWLWVRRKPYGHTPDFWVKMEAMGVSRWNPVPRSRPYKYLYRCPACTGSFPARRRLGPLACAKCCQKHSRGRYDSRFALQLVRRLAQGEAIETSPENLTS